MILPANSKTHNTCTGAKALQPRPINLQASTSEKCSHVYSFTYSHLGPSWDEQHQGDHTFFQHHDEQVDATLSEPRRSLGRVTCGGQQGGEIFKPINLDDILRNKQTHSKSLNDFTICWLCLGYISFNHTEKSRTKQKGREATANLFQTRLQLEILGFFQCVLKEQQLPLVADITSTSHHFSGLGKGFCSKASHHILQTSAGSTAWPPPDLTPTWQPARWPACPDRRPAQNWSGTYSEWRYLVDLRCCCISHTKCIELTASRGPLWWVWTGKHWQSGWTKRRWLVWTYQKAWKR